MWAAVLVMLLLSGDPAGAVVSGSPLAPPRHGGVYVVAHRGAHENIPENTLAAYRKAIELGADFVEIDLRETKDGHIVSMHNDMVDDYTKDAKGLVKNLTLAELRAMDIGSRVGPEWHNERVPTFEEILDLCKGKIGIYLDLKSAPVDKLLPMIQSRGMERNVLWYAGPVQMKQVQDHCPACILMPDPGPERFLPRLIEQWKPRVVAAVWKFMSEQFVKTCHDAGAIVIVDESGPECWESAMRWGLDGIQTDHPQSLIKFLEERKR